jgi:hypothetical protein
MDPLVQQRLITDWVLLATTVGLLVWVVYMVGNLIRRRQQAGMQKQILDKFASAQDFAQFIQSPAGQKYVMSFTDAVTSPRNSILNSVRTGILLLALGPALLTVSMRTGLWVLDLLGMSSACLGMGFLVSAVVSYFLVKKAGLGEKEKE